MTKENLAALLNGREIGNEITSAEAKQAKAAGLVVVYGASDDLMEFEGAIHDERGSFNGGEEYVNADGLLKEHYDNCECSHCGYKTAKATSHKIEARWCEGPYSWSFLTDIPHATFEVMEDGDKYCRGCVFSMNDLGGAANV